MFYLLFPASPRPLIQRRHHFWESQKWADSRPKRWSQRSCSKVSSISRSRYLLYEGYRMLTPFAIPQFNGDPVLILPPSYMKDIITRSDLDVSLPLVAEHNTAARYTGDEYIVRNPVHVDLVKRQLNRHLKCLTADIADELTLGFLEQWGSGQYKSVPLYTSCMKIVSRGANRVFCGADLCRCRNPNFLEHSRRYTQNIFAAAALINLAPAWLRPMISPFATYPASRQLEYCKAIAVPLIETRLKAAHGAFISQNDALQWLIEDCIKRGDAVELDPVMLCRRLLRLNMAAIHTTSISITNAILDLYTSPETTRFVGGLREECERTLAAHGGVWNKEGIDALVRTDSAIKESMRLRSFGLIGTNRIITNPCGLDLDGKIHIPFGVQVATPIDAIHRDATFYERPEVYDAFRFSQSRFANQVYHHGPDGSRPSQSTPDLTTTSDTFLVFGHGRHACPGRFFASQEMKLMLAHVVLNYEVEIKGPRPENRDIGTASLPDNTVQIAVRPRR
ncbi:putative P450 monooxygenase [Aureobasidium pullulans EXF-150]|uniref:Putative P450 monooxygenase n=1 Tax=Aureobasidium pullulans EXF-150 TaxID=1043002 RepID=A0A074X051_AURPU|nr:putative P450 monooxygenase [Aureobasidium pullulans EXF-150]KEQ78830.1 putative P450 monooxygenase [Aureobasidium pullulans EXF-150]